MNGITIRVLAIVVLGGAYLLYGRYLEKKWGIDPKAKTPAFDGGMAWITFRPIPMLSLAISLLPSQEQVRSTVRFRPPCSAGFRFFCGF